MFHEREGLRRGSGGIFLFMRKRSIEERGFCAQPPLEAFGEKLEECRGSWRVFL